MSKLKLRVVTSSNPDTFIKVKLKHISNFTASLLNIDDYMVMIYYCGQIHTIKANTKNIASHIVDLAVAIDGDMPRFIKPTKQKQYNKTVDFDVIPPAVDIRGK